MKITKIQWCDSTVNPVMGCEGCELWPTSRSVKLRLVNIIVKRCDVSRRRAKTAVRAAIGGSNGPTKIWHARGEICEILNKCFPEAENFELEKSIESQFICYAGI